MRTFNTFFLCTATLVAALISNPLLAQDKVQVLLHTNKGDIHLELDAEKAPISVENFVQYVNDKHYDGTIFHRVIKDFMIQGGGFDANMTQKPMRARIKNEANNGLKNTRGSIAMARTMDVNSATSQFFINLKDNDFLNHKVRDYGYAVFGYVTSGMDVVDAIGATQTSRPGDKPFEDIVLISAKVIAQPSQE